MVGTLSVSSTSLTSCNDIVEIMQKLGMNGNVTDNITIIDGKIEKGCQILIASEPTRENVQKVWKRLQDQLSFTCAHAEIKHRESGCVFDVFRESSCPGKK